MLYFYDIIRFQPAVLFVFFIATGLEADEFQQILQQHDARMEELLEESWAGVARFVSEFFLFFLFKRQSILFGTRRQCD